MIFEIFLLISLALFIFHNYYRNGRMGKIAGKIPGLPSWPLIGSLPWLIGSKDELWSVFRKLNNTHYPIFKFWTTHEVHVNVCHPDDIEVLLSSTEHINKSTSYQFLHPWLKTGLVTSTGNKWHNRRKILTNAFHVDVLKKYMDIINDNNDKLIKTIKTKTADGTVNNLVELLTNYTLNVICESAMGTELHETKEIQNYRDAVHVMGDTLMYRVVRPWFRSEYIFSWTKLGQKYVKALKLLHDFSSKIIQERKEYHEKTHNVYLNQSNSDETKTVENAVFGIRKKRLAILDLLIASAKNDGVLALVEIEKIFEGDDAGIQEEVDTFIFAGHDSLASGLCFALLLIAEHTDVQERARAEVNEVLERNDGKMNYSLTTQLHYLERCIKESLRLYPSAPFVSRQLHQDMQLKNYLIPTGATVHVHIFDVHRDPNFWTEPTKFDPDRFLPENLKKQHAYSYIPFSSGPRSCIGQKYTMMEFKAAMAALLHNFILEPIDLAHEVPIRSDLVLRPARPLRMKMTPILK